jgi:hypothetical protein
MLTLTENNFGESRTQKGALHWYLHADINADSSRKIRGKMKGREIAELLVFIQLENMLLLSHGKEVKERK